MPAVGDPRIDDARTANAREAQRHPARAAPAGPEAGPPHERPRPQRQLAEVDVGEERADVAPGQGGALQPVAPPRGRRDHGGALRRGLERLVAPERDVEERCRRRGRARAAGVRGIGAQLRKQIAVVRAVPQAHAGGQARGPAPRVPLPVGHPHLDLAPGGVERDGRRGARDGQPAGGVDQIRFKSRSGGVDREEQVGRRLNVGAVGEGVRLAGGAAQRDRERHQAGVLQCVQRDAEGRRVGEWLDAQLDEVGGVVRVAGVGRICRRHRARDRSPSPLRGPPFRHPDRPRPAPPRHHGGPCATRLAASACLPPERRRVEQRRRRPRGRALRPLPLGPGPRSYVALIYGSALPKACRPSSRHDIPDGEARCRCRPPRVITHR